MLPFDRLEQRFEVALAEAFLGYRYVNGWRACQSRQVGVTSARLLFQTTENTHRAKGVPWFYRSIRHEHPHATALLCVLPPNEIAPYGKSLSRDPCLTVQAMGGAKKP